jgi:hypothetical protein
MKKLLNGKLYDTAKASKLAQFTNGAPPHSPQYIKETLYRTPRGNYFIHGSGGYLTPYREVFGPSCGPGEDITALDRDQCLLWCERTGNEAAALLINRKALAHPEPEDQILETQLDLV